jgi:hypothetical protein
MNFYMHMLARFATQADLQLAVRFQVAKDVSPHTVDETRIAAEELGLGESRLEAISGE